MTADRIHLISRRTLDSIVDKASSIEAKLQGTGQEGDDHERYRTTFIGAVQSIKMLAVKAIKNNERHEKEYRSSFRVTLDDAVETLSDVRIEDSATFSSSDKPKAFGAMMGKLKFYEEQNNSNAYPRQNRMESRIPSGEGPKDNSKCKACGERNHWYRDPERVFNVMRTVMQGKDVHPDVIKNLSPSIRNEKAKDWSAKVHVADIMRNIGEDSAVKPGDDTKANKSYFR